MRSLNSRMVLLFYFLPLFIFASNPPEQPAVYDSLQLLYIANVNGVVENCNCGHPSLGGLARLSSLVAEKRKTHPGTIFIDGGDFLNPYPYPELNLAVLDIYKLLQPDIILVGDQEWVEEPPFLYRNFNLWPQITGTNFKIRNKKINKERVYPLSNGIRVRILTYLDICSFDLLGIPEKELIFDEKNFKRAVSRKKKDEILVVVFHGCVGGQGRFLRKYRQVDVLLVAHTQQTKLQLNRKPVIIPGGSDCRYLYQINIAPKEDSYTLKAKRLQVNKALKQDKRLLPILKRLKRK